MFVVFFILFLVALLILVNYAPVDGLLIPQDDKFRDELSVQAMINAISINAAIYFYVQTSEHRAEVDTENALARSEGSDRHHDAALRSPSG